MMRALLSLAAIGLVLPMTSAHALDFQRDCAQWIDKHGYSADYITLKTGERQRGTPDRWRGNVATKDVQAGDVVITPIQDKPPFLRVSYVEEVVRPNADGSPGAVVVTEWNEGRYVDEPCFVTGHFGRDSGLRSIPVDTIVRVWRPSLPQSGAPSE